MKIQARVSTQFPAGARPAAARCFALLLVLIAAAAPAGATQSPIPVCSGGLVATEERPLADFLLMQGRFDAGFLAVPPVPNFFGWTDPRTKLGLSVDYAGVADRACSGVAGTTFAGRVGEQALPDGRAAVTVEIYAIDAMTWVVDGFDFGLDPVVFGLRWEDDGAGGCAMKGTPAVGGARLSAAFINTEPGAALPDLFQLVLAPERGQELLCLSLQSEAFGETVDGTPSRATAHQVVMKNARGELEFVVEDVAIVKEP
jgi:hypothetical protein